MRGALVLLLLLAPACLRVPPPVRAEFVPQAGPANHFVPRRGGVAAPVSTAPTGRVPAGRS